MPNFKKFGELFYIFEFFREKTGFFGRCVSPPTLAFDRDLHLKKTWHFWIPYENLCMLRNYWEILTSFGPPKGSKIPQKCPLCYFLATQEAVLGELIFGGANGHQIKIFHLS